MAKSKAAFVTGATGFIGRHLIARLAEDGWHVNAFAHGADPGLAGAQIDTVSGDVLDADSLQRGAAGADVIFHLAGQASVDEASRSPAEAIQVNVIGTVNALEACRANGVPRFVYLSTMHVFGPPAVPPSGADRALDPRSTYAATKAAGERIAMAYGEAAGIEVVVLRPSNVYGPGQSTMAVVAEFVAAALEGRQIEVSDPEVRRNFLYVDDLIDAMVRAATEPAAAGRAINLEAPHSISIGELAALIRTAAASPAPAGTGHELPPALDAGHESNLLGFSPHTPIEEGLQRTVHAARQMRQEPLAPASAGTS